MRPERVLFSFALCIVIGLSLPLISYSQSADDGFNPNLSEGENVTRIAVQPDAKILVGAIFPPSVD